MNTRKKKWPCVNLAELVAFWQRRYGEDLYISVLAHDLGVSPQRISAMMVKDDARLSTLKQVVEKSGYQLTFEFCHATGGQGTGTPHPWTGAGDLMGLVEILYDLHRTANSAAAMSGISRDIVYHAFRRGDMMISWMLAIARSLDIAVIWRFEKIVA